VRTNPGQSSFSSGEISPLLYGRTDYQRVQTGLRRCRGFLPLRQGGVTRAPGTLYRGATKDDAAGRLIGFTFAENDSVRLEFTPNVMRVWRYGALVQLGGAPYELETPYGAGSIPRLKWVQSADRIWLVDGIQPMQELSRFALDNWTIGDAVLENGPFENENLDRDITVQASAETGTVTLTGVGDPFDPGMVGGLMSLRAPDNPDVGLWIGNAAISVGNRRIYDGKVYEYTSGTNTGPNPPTHTEGEVNVGSNANWLYLSDDTGIVRISGVTDSNTATGEVLKRLPQRVVDDPTYAWAEGAFNPRNGYPSAIALHEQRMWLGRTARSPRTLWASAVGAFRLFEPGIEADESFAFTIDGGTTQNAIQWLQPGARGIHVGALGEEYSSKSSSALEAIGPQNAVFRLDSSFGSLDAQPVAPDGRPIFIARDGARVFELRYQFDADANVAVELSLPSEHLGAEGFAEIVWAAAPQRIAWLRRGDGTLAAMVHDPNEDVLGWAPVPVAGGAVESIAVTPNETGTADQVTLIVRRVIDGQTVRHVEDLSPSYGTVQANQPIATANHLFAAVVKTGAPFAAVEGLEHLEGETVAVWTDAGELGPLVVEAGAVTLPAMVTRATVGLFDDTHLIETLDVAGGVREGSPTGRQKRLKGVGMRWHQTAGAEIRTVEREFGRPDIENMWADVLNAPVPGDMTAGFGGTTHASVPSGYAREVTVQVRPRGGAPMTLLAVTPLLDTAGG
jgi:hypothetical protein